MIYLETSLGALQLLRIRLKVLRLKRAVDLVYGMISAKSQEMLLMEIVEQ